MSNSKTRIETMGRTAFRTLALAVAIGACLPTYSSAAEQETPRKSAVNFNIPAGDLSVAIERFSTQSGIQVMYRQDLVLGLKSAAITSELTPTAALTQLLKGTGLSLERVNDKTYVLKKAPNPPRKSDVNREERSDSGATPKKAEETISDLEKIVVVGSRLGTSPYDAMSMAKVIDRVEIERSGAGNIAQVLSYLSEVSVNNSGDSVTTTVAGHLGGRAVGFSTVQLRGLPQGTTLVLINGRRAGGSAAGYGTDFFDLSTIPLSMVERIEVLPMGASAVYGGDGLAGVVNIVLKRDADSLEFQARSLDADGYSETNTGVTFGKTWSRGRMMFSATKRKTGELGTDEREITADADYRRYGGADRRSTFSYPGNVYSMDGCGTAGEYGYFCSVPLNERGNLPGLNSAFAAVPTGQNGQSLTPQDFASTAGNLSKLTERSNLVSPSEQYGLSLNGSFDLSESTEFFAEWNLTQRKVNAKELPLVISGGQSGLGTALVPAENPFNPFGVEVGVDYRFENTGIFQNYSQTYWRGLIGAKGERKQWGWEVSAWQSREWSDTGNVSYFDSNLIQQALRSSDPSVALNPFAGDGSAPASADVIRGLAVPSKNAFSTTVRGVNAFVRGSMTIPTGRATGLIGAEYEQTLLDANPWASLVANASGDDKRQAIFTEARIPLLEAKEGGWLRLGMNAAARYESTGRSQGNAFTKLLGVEFRPAESLSLRFDYGTSFKPINLYTASMDEQIFFAGVPDPKFGDEQFFVQLIFAGGVPADLKPEESTSRNISLIYAPSQDLRLSIMHWDNRLRNRIASLFYVDIVQKEDLFPGRVIRDPETGYITIVDGRPVNIAATDNAGVDFGADATFSTKYGEFNPSLSATYVYKYDEQLTPDSDVENQLAKWSSTGWSPRWKIVPKLGWQWRDFANVHLVGRYVSSYKDPEPLTEGESAGKVQRLGDFWLFDLGAELDLSQWLAGKTGHIQQVRLNLGVTNLLNDLPKYCNTCAVYSYGGYDAYQYDILGRRAFAEIRVGF